MTMGFELRREIQRETAYRCETRDRAIAHLGSWLKYDDGISVANIHATVLEALGIHFHK